MGKREAPVRVVRKALPRLSMAAAASIEQPSRRCHAYLGNLGILEGNEQAKRGAARGGLDLQLAAQLLRQPAHELLPHAAAILRAAGQSDPVILNGEPQLAAQRFEVDADVAGAAAWKGML